MKKDLIYIIIILCLIVLAVFGFNKINNLSNKFENYENTINALNDSISVNIENGIKTYSKKTPEIDINDLINSEYFKTLDESTKNYYNELHKIKRLLAANKAELEVVKSLNQTINNVGVINNDSITFKRKTVLKFGEKDTTKHLQWNSNITLDDSIKFNFDYDYKFEVATTFERQKDKSILVKYKLDDPDIKINKINSFIIPPEQANTKIGKWYNKNKKAINITTHIVAFGAGIYTAIKVIK